jgi:hypothetical protein
MRHRRCGFQTGHRRQFLSLSVVSLEQRFRELWAGSFIYPNLELRGRRLFLQACFVGYLVEWNGLTCYDGSVQVK